MSRMSFEVIRTVSQLDRLRADRNARDAAYSIPQPEFIPPTPEALAHRLKLRLQRNHRHKRRGSFGPGFSQNGNW